MNRRPGAPRAGESGGPGAAGAETSAGPRVAGADLSIGQGAARGGPGERPDAAADDYLGRVAAGLRGPRRSRRRILAELRDGLDAAIADRVAAGLPADQATAEAIARFGSPAAVAAAFAGELTIAWARRTLLRYVFTGPLVGIWWLLLLHPHPWRAGLLGLLAAVPVVPLVALALAAAGGTLATTGRLMRWLPEAGPRRALTGAVAVAALAVLGDAVVIVLGGRLFATGAVGPPALVAVAVAASLTRIACGVVAMIRAARLR